MNNSPENNEYAGSGRRDFLRKGMIVTLSGISLSTALIGCLNDGAEGEADEKEVSPPEDLMQEHGALKRILLIYDTCRAHLANGEPFPIEALTGSAGIIRSFVEDYHEKQEETYLFPRFKKANLLTDLVDVLLQQHQAGRRITDEITHICGRSNRTEAENDRLAHLLLSFGNMYNPHEAREDTVLFPAFRKLVSKNEYYSLGEEFEKNEHKLFGEDGFGIVVDKVADIEKSLGIYDLAQFTPKI